jgi:AraC-like DNA-binding protein
MTEGVSQHSEAALAPDEQRWREPGGPGHEEAQRILIGRWRQAENSSLTVSARAASHRHVIGIALRRMNVRFEVDGRVLHDGSLMPGSFNITAPGTSASAEFRGPFDVLHLSVPDDLVVEYGLEASDAGKALPASRACMVPDLVLCGLASALINARHLGASVAGLYADSVGLAIVARLMSAATGSAGGDRPRVAPLPKWRLKRALAYIEENLSETVSLAEMAAAAGLTRMHFAAQFRAATGLPPHEFLLRRRIEAAQEMLVRSRTPVVEVALQVGFQTQAHFTTVFKRFSGFPPHAWRQMQREAA